jgi:protein-L-isoaspartate(D-aspartate) O-methyltransferase
VNEELSRLLREVAAEAQATAAYTGIAAFNPRVMAAMGAVPRHEFVPEEERVSAYLDMPLPIGHGQTISQPYIVALMTDLLEVKSGDTVLEVGAGSGYQAAVLAKLAKQVHSIEIVPELARACSERLARLGIANVTVHEGDGAAGLAAEAPFDAIIVTAAARRVPKALVAQLKPGGRMAIPLGEPWSTQELALLEKDARGEVAIRPVLAVRFVPLTGGR